MFSFLGRRHLLAAAGLLIILLSASWPAQAQFGPAPVSVMPVVEREINATRSFAATVMPLRTSIIGSAVDGRVEEFLVNEGDRVTKGQPLCRLRTRLLEIQIDGAKAELELRRHELAELQNGSRPEEIAQSRARVAAAEALYEFNQGKLRRAQALSSQRGMISQDELQETTSAAEAALQTLLEARAAHELAVAGPRKERILQAEARVATAAEAIRELEDQLEKHTIEAPFDGYVVEENTEVGQWIIRGSPVVKMVELAQVDVQALVPEAYLSQLQLQMPANVTFEALPGKAFTGPVAAIVPQAELRSRSFPVKVRLDNPDSSGLPLLKPGMLARVSLAVGEREKSLLVPKDALVLGGEKPIVVVADRAGDGPQAKARPVPVEVGAAAEGMIAVQPLASLKPGELVIVEGNERAQPGQDLIIARVVSPKPATAPPAAPAPVAEGPQAGPPPAADSQATAAAADGA